jgi:type VI secretion system secreted protein VgrG
MDDAYTIKIIQKHFNSLYPVGLEFTESLNEPFHGILTVISSSLLLGSQFIFKPITCIITHANTERIYNGIVTAVEREPHGNKHQIKLVIRPHLYRLSRDHNYKIFTNKTPIEIADSILSEHAIIYKSTIQKRLPKLQLFVQYNESSLNALHRLFASYGLYYHFEHTRSFHVMHISDRIINPTAKPQPDFNATNITQQRHETRIGANAYASDRYHAETPYTPVKFNTQGQQTNSLKLCRYHYPHTCENQEQAIFRQAIEAGKLSQTTLWKLETNNQCITTGKKITTNNDVITVFVKHDYTFQYPHTEGSNEIAKSYRNTIKAIPYNTPHYDCHNYSPPVAAGIQIASTVTNQSPTQISDHASVKIQFPWDENKSIWVRSSHVYAGQQHGALTPYRNNSPTVIQWHNNNPNTPNAIGQLYTKEAKNTFKQHSYYSSGIKTQSFSNQHTERYHQLKFYDETNKECLLLKSGYQQTENICNDYLLNSNMDFLQTINSGNQSTCIKNGKMTISANKITLHCGDSSIVLDDKGIHFNAAKITLDTGGKSTQPVARTTDKHTCPKYTGGIVPHHGGKITQGSNNVLINNQAAARQGDSVKCHTATSTISSGNPKVLINGKPIARKKDQTLHKGEIVTGSNNVHA